MKQVAWLLGVVALAGAFQPAWGTEPAKASVMACLQVGRNRSVPEARVSYFPFSLGNGPAVDGEVFYQVMRPVFETIALVPVQIDLTVDANGGNFVGTYSNQWGADGLGAAFGINILAKLTPSALEVSFKMIDEKQNTIDSADLSIPGPAIKIYDLRTSSEFQLHGLDGAYISVDPDGAYVPVDRDRNGSPHV